MANGSLYGVVALCIALAFAARPLLNFAQGEFVMIGAMVALVGWEEHGWPAPAPFFVAALLGGVAGLLVEALVVRPILVRSSPAIATLALLGGSSILTGVAALTVTDLRERVSPIIAGDPLRVGSASLFRQSVALIVVALACALGARLLMRRTAFGLRLRALSQLPLVASLYGIDARRSFRLVYGVGGSLCAVAGVLGSQLTGAYPGMGLPLVIKGFIGAAIGGLANPPRALLGGLFVGVFESILLPHVAPGIAEGAAVALLLVVLAVRPEGLGTTAYLSREV